MRFIGDLIHLLQLAIQIAIQIAVKSQVVYTCAINRRDKLNRIKNRMCKQALMDHVMLPDYITDNPNHRHQIKAYRTGYLNMPIENELLSFLQSLHLKVSIIFRKIKL